MKKLSKFSRLSLVAIGGIALGVGAYQYNKQYQMQVEKEELYKQTYESLTINYSDIKEIEYGSDFSLDSVVTDYVGNMRCSGEVDTSQVGDYVILYTLSANEEKYDQDVVRGYTRFLKVVDTQAPIITLKEDAITIEEGEEYSPSDNIKKVEDVVDGELDKDFYSVSGDFDYETPGEYKITVKAKDKNGLSSKKEFTIVVEEKAEEAIVTQHVAANTAGNYDQVFNYLTNTLGYSKAMSCGIIANIYFCVHICLQSRTSSVYWLFFITNISNILYKE